ncbi:fungal class II heme-containing peroxidase [Dionaea muscipula]
MQPTATLFALALASFLSFHVPLAVAAGATSGENPFTPKAYLIRYWNNKIYNVPRSEFLLSKASPLSAAEAASFAQLASQKSLSAHLDPFCKSAHLLCFPDLRPSLEKHDNEVNSFDNYKIPQNFTNYGTRKSGNDKFEQYDEPEFNNPKNTFHSYGREAAGRSGEFTKYGIGGDEINETFNSYGIKGISGEDQFTLYAGDGNVPELTFGSYSASAKSKDQTFVSYSNGDNVGTENFTSYGKDENSATNSFNSYADKTNGISNGFSSYGSGSGDVNSNFTSYGSDATGPQNNFNNYGKDGKAAATSFSNYGNDSVFVQSGFSGYSDGNTAGSDNFTSYGDGAGVYALNSFKNYGEHGEGVAEDFKGYRVQRPIRRLHLPVLRRKIERRRGLRAMQTIPPLRSTTRKGSPSPNTTATTSAAIATNAVAAHTSPTGKGRRVEAGRFFREEMLKSGVEMPMPDIRDKMPQRAFLPRSIVSKIPFSSSEAPEIKEIFHAFDNSTMETIIHSALHECERAPSRGETKRCVGSAEDMIDFAVSVLGRSTEVRTTENVNGSGKDIVIGNVRGINGGRVTQSVSCHQSMYPYLLYYCHSVPKVRVYEADILDPINKVKINHGIAICHVDTSDWSPTHGAFWALGSGPGKIEVCHWIFENDLTWTIAD